MARLSLNHAKELIEELIRFLNGLGGDSAYKIGGIIQQRRNRIERLSMQLQYFRRELDFASVAVLSTLAVHGHMVEAIVASSKNPAAISLSSLLKASQRLCSMTDITGRIYTAKGRFFVLSERIRPGKGENIFAVEAEPEEVENENEFEDFKSPANESHSKALQQTKSLLEAGPKDPGKPAVPEEESKEKKAEDENKPPEKIWRQEGPTAELAVSLNLVLNMYVLQIFVQDPKAEEEPELKPEPKPKPSQAKYTFYIDYDLHFRVCDSGNLGIKELVGGTALQDPGAKSTVFHWRSTIDPDVEYEVIVNPYPITAIEHATGRARGQRIRLLHRPRASPGSSRASA